MFVPTRAGSSPRLWGTRPARGRIPHRCRFIPTPVGNTPPSGRCRTARPVHPHACGEHDCAPPDAIGGPGSSPRLWGTPAQLLHRHHEARFIPTPVGNTRRAQEKQGSRPVHPHACGEHIITDSVPLILHGSSPRLWGTRSSAPAFCRRSAVHPHACGEHAAISHAT